jgi:hypothetical protein
MPRPKGGGVSLAKAVLGQPLVIAGELTGVPEAGPLQFMDDMASIHPPLTQQPRTYEKVTACSLGPLCIN